MSRHRQWNTAGSYDHGL